MIIFLIFSEISQIFCRQRIKFTTLPKVIEVKNSMWEDVHEFKGRAIVKKKGYADFVSINTDPAIIWMSEVGYDEFFLQFNSGKFLCASPTDSSVKICSSPYEPYTKWRIYEIDPQSFAIVGKDNKCLRRLGTLDYSYYSPKSELQMVPCDSLIDKNWSIIDITSPSLGFSSYAYTF